MKEKFNVATLKNLLQDKLNNRLGIVKTENASNEIYYQAVAMVINDIMYKRRQQFWSQSLSAHKKQIHYLSMEFLLGRNLKNSLFNLGLLDDMKKALKSFSINVEDLYDCEPDAGLGNGGLGRLAACYMDALASNDFLGTGYCILYEYGMFKQEIIDGWQNEGPDVWLPGGSVWLSNKPGVEIEVKFDGYIDEIWKDNQMHISYKNYSSVYAVPYDINLPGYNSDGVSLLRVWQAKSNSTVDMESFNRGDYGEAFENRSTGEAISKVLYPNDNHLEGKILRLKQQYFLCAASIQDICRRHLSVYGTLENFSDKNAIHINDTHPALAIAEIMRFFVDDCGYDWDFSWKIVNSTFAYTNHTVMREALEQWDINIFKTLLPRVYSIIEEINRRFCSELYNIKHLDDKTVSDMAILSPSTIRMANLAIVGSHKVNGVSKLHSEIIREDVFNDFYKNYPDKFTNVTNGIAARRWLLQSNPSLTDLISTEVGIDFKKDLSKLSKLSKFKDNKPFIDKLLKSKRTNKEYFSNYLYKKSGILINPDSIYDVQVKRIHEYKRQQMNALEILSTYYYLKENSNVDITPRTYIFGGKAAPGYFMAKQFIRLISAISEKIEKDKNIKDKMKVVFLEEYNVTTSEFLMPASDISQQISLAGTEASGTGNMKLMLNGAITLGTLDGANVEICEQVGNDNIIIFGMTEDEVNEKRRNGYHPSEYYNNNPTIKKVMDALISDFDTIEFSEIYGMLLNSDYYMTLADFDAFKQARIKSEKLYTDKYTWGNIMLKNIAKSGYFSADRAINEYAKNIWNIEE